MSKWHKKYLKVVEDSPDGGVVVSFVYWNDDWKEGVEEKFCTFDALDHAVRFQEILKEAGYNITDEYPDPEAE